MDSLGLRHFIRGTPPFVAKSGVRFPSAPHRDYALFATSVGTPPLTSLSVSQVRVDVNNRLGKGYDREAAVDRVQGRPCRRFQFSTVSHKTDPQEVFLPCREKVRDLDKENLSAP